MAKRVLSMIWRRVAAGSSNRVGNSTLGDDREIVARKRRQVEPRAAGDDLHLAVGGGEFDLAALGELADNIEKGVRGNRGGAGLRDVRGDAFIDLEVEIGRHQPQRAVVARLDQHIAEDGNRLRRSTTDWTWPSALRRTARSIVAFMPLPVPCPGPPSLGSP